MKPAIQTDRARIENAKTAAISRLKAFRPITWWGPVTDAIGLVCVLELKQAPPDDLASGSYFDCAPHGFSILVRAAEENYEAYLLLRMFVASKIHAGQPIPHEMRQIAGHIMADTHAPPSEPAGAKRRSKWHRDVTLNMLIAKIATDYALKRTENEARSGNHLPSASRIVELACRHSGNPYLRDVTHATVRKLATENMVYAALEEATDQLGSWFSVASEDLASRAREINQHAFLGMTTQALADYLSCIGTAKDKSDAERRILDNQRLLRPHQSGQDNGLERR